MSAFALRAAFRDLWSELTVGEKQTFRGVFLAEFFVSKVYFGLDFCLDFKSGVFFMVFKFPTEFRSGVLVRLLDRSMDLGDLLAFFV